MTDRIWPSTKIEASVEAMRAIGDYVEDLAHLRRLLANPKGVALEMPRSLLAKALVARMNELQAQSRLEGRISETNARMWDQAIAAMRDLVTGSPEPVTWNVEQLRNVIGEPL
jgi:hypothetical protein